VAGFLAIIGPFPGWKRFILREKKEPSLRAEASLLQQPGNNYTFPDEQRC